MSVAPRPPVTGRTGLRLAFYGDDFTGSSDALEVLAFAGVRCAMFVEPPSPEALQRFEGLEVIGIAGDSRAMSPAEMSEALPPLFDALAALDVPMLHYKVCSTFDSGPDVGSIGRVIEIARERFAAPFVPVVAGTPALGRYCLFGHLFARSATDNRVHRIDRHPIMSVHPVTPMGESDLARHFARQAELRIGNLAFPALDAGHAAADAELRRLCAAGLDAVVIDGATERHLTEVGRLLDAMARDVSPLFVVGSSGTEYALTQWWRESEPGARPLPDYDTLRPADRVLAVSGSASRLSAQQIDAAIAAGFADLAVDANALVNGPRWEDEARRLVAHALAALDAGRSVIVHTARGPDDPRIGAMLGALHAAGHSHAAAKREGGRRLGIRLGQIVAEVLQRSAVQRLLLSGGDTSSQVTKVLAPQALVVAARLAPGAPLCRLVAEDARLDGLEIALKGGQMGSVDFFDKARRGSR